MTVNDIVKRSRTRLGDTKKTGWTDETLIDYVDQAQKDLCKESNIYKRTLYLGILNNQTLYPLPLDCFQISRVEYVDEPLAFLSREDQDSRAASKGLHIIKSDIDMSLIELSEPLLELSDYATCVEGLDFGIDDPIVSIETPLGVLTGIDSTLFTFDNALGVVSGFLNDNIAGPQVEVLTDFGDISDFYVDPTSTIKSISPEGVTVGMDLGFASIDSKNFYGFLTTVGHVSVKGVYGICTEALVVDNYMKVYYSAIPPEVNSIYDALVVSSIWAKALVHYVVGMARQDDNDEANFQIGEAELNKYDKELKKAKKLSARSYSTPIAEVKETTYRRI